MVAIETNNSYNIVICHGGTTNNGRDTNYNYLPVSVVVVTVPAVVMEVVLSVPIIMIIIDNG